MVHPPNDEIWFCSKAFFGFWTSSCRSLIFSDCLYLVPWCIRSYWRHMSIHCCPKFISNECVMFSGSFPQFAPFWSNTYCMRPIQHTTNETYCTCMPPIAAAGVVLTAPVIPKQISSRCKIAVIAVSALNMCLTRN